MRKQINGLAALVQEEMGQSPFSGGWYVFCGRDRRRVKVLYWDRTGFALWQKRLERDRFPWPEAPGQVRQLTEQEIQWLLQGIDFFHAHQELRYQRV